ncbi:amino acid ABC transporter ATP-binding protein [Comamonadaceae bacterium G21597-S1]|nr:amino acid ABC transporter ATP-binding protein [Comamonadaceae bacterium G21597-S1]
MSAIRVRDLRKSFGHTEVIKGVSFDVAPGQVTSLLGPSGSGKSTVLRCINFIEPYDAGCIEIGGKAVGFVDCTTRKRQSDKDLSALRARVGIVYQAFNLFGHLSVMENLMLAPIRVLKWPRDRAHAKAHALLRKVGLSDKADAYPAFLSGGQQQRVAIARALCMQPEVMLFDEVTSALDPERSREVLSVMRELADEGMTMMVVTHEMEFARDVSDQVVFMEDGVIVEQGPPAEVMANPQSSRLRSFLQHSR